jgi:subtilisin family serine protease
MTHEVSDPAVETQLDTGWEAINAVAAISAYGDRTATTDPALVGHVGRDVLRTAEFDVVAERDFTSDPEPNAPTDTHGTLVVSQYAAERNATGIASLSEAEVAVAQFMSETFDRSYPVRVGAAIRWLVEYGVDIINMSWSFGEFFGAELFRALQYAGRNGVLVVTSAGNEGTDKPRLTYPHQFDLPNVVTVAATTGNDDALAEFSNFAEWVDVAAPGAPLAGYVPDPLFGEPDDNPDAPWNLVFAYGTSFAAPLVADVAAFMCEVNPRLRGRPTVLKRLLTGTAQDMALTGPVAGKAGAGRVDALAAAQAAADPLGYVGRADD